MTRAELLALVYEFYPRGILPGGWGYRDTEERQRQLSIIRRGAAEYPTWKAMLRRLGARYPFMDRSTCFLTGIYDPAYSAYLVIPGRTLGFHVCLLGPYYGIHLTGAPGEEPAALDIAREIEATYPGYEPIPPEFGKEEVPEVCLNSRGMSTIYDYLLSEEWRRGSRPYDDTPSPPYVEPPADSEADDPEVPHDNTRYKDTWTRL